MIIKPKKLIGLILLHTFLISVALSCICPLFWMINASFKTNEEFRNDYGLELAHEFNGDNYKKARFDGGLGIDFLNSVFYTFITVFF
ncbi:MAG: carbohydrate ABC transporter permease, partial [Candidatus Omnitrophica bacterium]|nr:carbohydrate ABC transporter permease [Candidatus Omnitrophota bacterium]